MRGRLRRRRLRKNKQREKEHFGGSPTEQRLPRHRSFSNLRQSPPRPPRPRQTRYLGQMVRTDSRSASPSMPGEGVSTHSYRTAASRSLDRVIERIELQVPKQDKY